MGIKGFRDGSHRNVNRLTCQNTFCKQTIYAVSFPLLPNREHQLKSKLTFPLSGSKIGESF